jgi:hypothetical protein
MTPARKTAGKLRVNLAGFFEIVKRRGLGYCGEGKGPSEIVNDHCGIRKEISHVVNTSHGVKAA